MNNEPDDKAEERPDGDRPKRPVLRLVPGDGREEGGPEPRVPRALGPARKTPAPAPDGDDDDPGPAAA
jgi:hypothetical protein